MPYYTCNVADCSTGGSAFSLNSAGQTFCPKCNTAGGLSAAATPVTAPITQTAVIQDSNAMDAVGDDKNDVETLIAKWDLNLVSAEEAKKKHDCLFKLDKRAQRIDREGQVTTAGVITHAKFRLQFGKKTYAGIHIKIDQILDAATIRRAFHDSLAAKRYVEVFLG